MFIICSTVQLVEWIMDDPYIVCISFRSAQEVNKGKETCNEKVMSFVKVISDCKVGGGDIDGHYSELAMRGISASSPIFLLTQYPILFLLPYPTNFFAGLRHSASWCGIFSVCRLWYHEKQ